ncbi:MAG TPA: membrane dipeptidase, partial [Chitinophagaceae bacterium]|nr:membrane dipeptidase [Chitinophagaceae bacterium]
VDLTHTTPAARNEVFTINSNRAHPRPLVFTHTGSQQVFEKYNEGHHPNFKYYCLSDNEIFNISKCNGIIGIIPENFWLVGANTHLKQFDPKLFRNGIAYMIETIKDINCKTVSKDYSNIGIGTDFDGLADVPADFYKPSQGGKLIAELHKHFTDKQVSMMTSGNALRVLREGWL